jgi:hypothetical protein
VKKEITIFPSVIIQVKGKNQAVSRRKVEPWGLVEDCEEERKKKRKER